MISKVDLPLRNRFIIGVIHWKSTLTPFLSFSAVFFRCVRRFTQKLFSHTLMSKEASLIFDRLPGGNDVSVTCVVFEWQASRDG